MSQESSESLAFGEFVRECDKLAEENDIHSLKIFDFKMSDIFTEWGKLVEENHDDKSAITDEFGYEIMSTYLAFRRTHADVNKNADASLLDQIDLNSCRCVRTLLEHVFYFAERVLKTVTMEELHQFGIDRENINQFSDGVDDPSKYCDPKGAERQQVLATDPIPPIDELEQPEVKESSKETPPRQQSSPSQSSSSRRSWHNPPSLSICGLVDLKVFVQKRETHEKLWNGWCDRAFGTDVPSKFLFENVDRVEIGKGRFVTVSFLKRPRKQVLKYFANEINSMGGVRVNVLTYGDYSPQSSSSSSHHKHDRIFSPILTQQQQQGPRFSNLSYKQAASRSQSRDTRQPRRLVGRSPTIRRLDFTTHSHLDSTQTFGNNRRPHYRDTFWNRWTSHDRIAHLEDKIDRLTDFLCSHFGFG